jgi:hypothetical protein
MPTANARLARRTAKRSTPPAAPATDPMIWLPFAIGKLNFFAAHRHLHGSRPFWTASSVRFGRFAGKFRREHTAGKPRREFRAVEVFANDDELRLPRFL